MEVNTQAVKKKRKIERRAKSGKLSTPRGFTRYARRHPELAGAVQEMASQVKTSKRTKEIESIEA